MRLPLPLLLFTLALLPAAHAAPVSEASQFGITWKFDQPREAGRFANGDWWVLGPVTITEITPKTTGETNGSMINPQVNGAQGFDSRIKNNKFDAELNVASRLPLKITEPSSLVSAISLEGKSERDDPQMETVAILTVVTEKPKDGDFRPPYQGTDKTILGNAGSLNFKILAKAPVVEGAKSPDEIAAAFERPWIELKTNWTGRYMHPKENQPPYGRDLAHVLGTGLLILNLDYSEQEKRTLMIRLAQYGLDIYGAAREGAHWDADGGHNQGRKLPLLLAGKALGNSAILEYGDARKQPIFQEDQQTFFITQEDIDLPRSTKRETLEPYTAEMLGKPEWGIRHASRPESDSASWDAKYRLVSGAPTFSHYLAARLMGLENDWGHPAFFAYYQDRYWDLEKDSKGKGPNGITELARRIYADFNKETAAR